MITQEQLVKRLGIVTKTFIPALPSELEKMFFEECKKHGLKPVNCTYTPRIVLCGRVAYVSVFDLITSEHKFNFTFNSALQQNWRNSIGKKKGVFCHKIFWTHGAEVLTTLDDTAFLCELKKIKFELAAKYGYNLKNFIFDAYQEYQPWGGSLTCKNLEKLLDWLFYQEFPFLKDSEVF